MPLGGIGGTEGGAVRIDRRTLRPPGQSRWSSSRLLFLAGVVVAIAAIVSWLVVGNGDGSTDAGGGACRVPAHATRGTEPAPDLVTTVTAPLGGPDVTFTQTSAGVTVYGYCYDVVGGDTLASTLALLRQQPYTSAPGSNPTQQLNFTATGLTPYGVSVSVGGDLDVSRPTSGTYGSVSIVWTDHTLPAD
jgi:hypothetical protein